MVYRKKPRYGRRKRFKRGYRRFRRTMYRRGGTFNTAKFKLRALNIVTSSAFGVIQYAFSMTNPALWDQTNPLSEWTHFTNLYDRYRVTGIKCKFIPHKPSDTSTTTSFQPLYVVADYDDLGAPTSIQQMLDYDKCRVFNLFSPWSAYWKIPKLANPGQTGVISLRSGMMDIAAPQSTGSIKMFSSGLDLSDNYGDMVFTYYIRFAQRR